MRKISSGPLFILRALHVEEPGLLLKYSSLRRSTLRSAAGGIWVRYVPQNKRLSAAVTQLCSHKRATFPHSLAIFPRSTRLLSDFFVAPLVSSPVPSNIPNPGVYLPCHIGYVGTPLSAQQVSGEHAAVACLTETIEQRRESCCVCNIYTILVYYTLL